MCGRYTLANVEGLQDRFDTENRLAGIRPNYNVAPGQSMPVITRNSPNKIEIMKWGFVPSWAKDVKIGYKMINARAEGIEVKPSFRSAIKCRRCLVPATGFYEWKKKEGIKVPMHIRLSDREVFSFAGLWEHWQDKDGNELNTYTIITTSPNGVIAGIHDRMPVILREEEEDMWIDPEIQDPAHVLGLLRPYTEKGMEAYPVSEAVGNVRNNSKELLCEVANS
jgi:putative SOS response-associated peptidase YedK